MPLYFITGNANKFAEAKEIVPELERMDVDLPEVQDFDPRTIIRAKLEEARHRHDGAFVVEDTSLSLECLGGLPGPLIKWFLQAMGNAGLCEFAERFGNDRAEARTMIGYADPNGDVHFFEGVILGRIVRPTGKSPFGWDPVFRPDGHDATFAEMGREAKQRISMRRKAFEGLRAHLDAARGGR
jgi:non-canonical purine NTP pyrophosphatase (RdgB/HAM1 family)